VSLGGKPIEDDYEGRGGKKRGSPQKRTAAMCPFVGIWKGWLSPTKGEEKERTYFGAAREHEMLKKRTTFSRDGGGEKRKQNKRGGTREIVCRVLVQNERGPHFWV